MVLSILLVLGVGVVVYFAVGGDKNSSEVVTNTVTSQSSQASSISSESVDSAGNYTLGEVSKHNDVSSCWTVINGNVYDLTTYVKLHPGGQERILSICGRDGTNDFNMQHSGMLNVSNILKTFIVGKVTI